MTATHQECSPGHPGTARKRDDALRILHEGVRDLVSSEQWRSVLAFRKRFHAYSFFNTSLIYAQKPNATHVAGYRAWQSLNRQVRKGEKGIAILAPLARKNPEDENRTIVTGFRFVHVFDVTQTDGDPIPTLEAPTLLSEISVDSERVARFTTRLVAYLTHRDLTVRFDLPAEPRALGIYRPGKQEIALRDDLPLLQRFKTLIHESAHALLHTGSDDRAMAELEAESTAFLVAHHLGLDTSAYSFVYLAHWTRSLDDLMRAGENASKAADVILTAMSSLSTTD